MQTVIVAILLLVLAMLALGIGLVLGRPPLQRSCGAVPCVAPCEGCSRMKREPAP